MSYEVTYKGHQRIDDTGKPYYVNEYTESYTVPTQYKVFFTLSLFCGFRKGETLALHWNDIDFKEKKISISKSVRMTENGFDYKEPKTKKSVRKVSIPDDVIPLLKQYHFEYIQTRFSHGTAWQGDLSNGGNLFIQADGKLMGHTTPYQYFTKHLHRYNEWVQNNPDKAKAEGLEELPIIPLHGLRHSCATLLNYLEVNIIEISKTLGHSTCCFL
ncbi:site-specific integrase [uncultured Allobaculum sp.]|nr:site-specific integrase [uncultured Allobaculum sp.]